MDTRLLNYFIIEGVSYIAAFPVRLLVKIFGVHSQQLHSLGLGDFDLA